MAKRRTAAADDITLYDIDPAFQDKLIAWLSTKPNGIVVDIGATPEAFTVTLDPGGVFLDESFEHVLRTAMGSRSKKKFIDPEMEDRVHAFLYAAKAHLTFGGDGDVFNMTVSNPDSRGTASDEDFEIALVIAEEQFWDNMPAKPKVQIVAAPPPMISAEAREQMLDETLPPGMAAYLRPKPTLAIPPRPSLPPPPARTPGGFAPGWQPQVARPQLPPPPPPKPAPKPKAVPLKLPLSPAPAPVMTSLGPAPSFFSGPPSVFGQQAKGSFLAKNRRALPYHDWATEVGDHLARVRLNFVDADEEYWRRLYQAGFSPSQAAEEFDSAWLSQRGYVGNKRRPPPPPSVFGQQASGAFLAKNMTPAMRWTDDVSEELKRRGRKMREADDAFWRLQRTRSHMISPQQGADNFEQYTSWVEQVRRLGGPTSSSLAALWAQNMTPQDAVRSLSSESDYAGNKRRPPPPPSSKPFDPEAPREHYARSHHFAVNAHEYTVLFDGRPIQGGFASENAADSWIEDRVDDAPGVGTAVDVIAQEHDERVALQRELLDEGTKLFGAAVHVADREDGLRLVVQRCRCYRRATRFTRHSIATISGFRGN